MNRCIPGNLVMSEAVPRGQRWTYCSYHSMAEMLNETYYGSVKHQFMAGDDMRIMMMTRAPTKRLEKVISFTDILVTAAQDNLLKFHIISGPIILDKGHGYDIQKEGNEWAVTEHGKILQTYPNKKEAESALNYFSSEKVVNG